MRNDKLEHDDNQFYMILFFIILFFLILYVAVKFWWIRAPDLDTQAGRCEAFCAGISKMAIGVNKERLPLECFCDYPPTPIDKRLLRRP